MAKLIAFDQDHNLQYEGFCKLSINKLSSILIVEPKNEEYKLISASFNLKYVMQNNLLFVLREYDFMNFCLVFKDKKICKKVYSHICQQQNNQVRNINASFFCSFFGLKFAFKIDFIRKILLKNFKEICDRNLIEIQILIPVFNKIQENPNSNKELIEIIAKWIFILDESSKQHYINLLKERNIYDSISSFMPNIGLVQLPKYDKRKRKFDDVRNGKTKEAKNVNIERSINKERALKKHVQIINFPQLKVMKNGIRQSLIIYTSSEISSFHEYRMQSTKSKVFTCCKCLLHTAILGHDENGNICAKLRVINHDCETQTIIPADYSEIKIIKNFDYEIYENYSKTTKRLLVLLDPENRNMCHEFLWNANCKKFVCRNCCKINAPWKNRCLAKIRNEGKIHEFLEVVNSSHKCEKIKYDIKKYQISYEHVLKPHFEIRQILKRGREIRTLILFKNANDKNLCYIYYFDGNVDCFICNFCRKMGKYVTAKLYQNSDGEEYIVLAKPEHICGLRPLPRQETVLCPPEIEVLEDTKTGVPKIFVFINESRKMCYTFTKDKTKNFFCMGCNYVRSKTEKKEVVSGYLVTEKNGNHSFKLKEPNQKHICKPKKYEPEKYQNFKTTDFFYFRQTCSTIENLNLAVYNPNDKNMCYIFEYYKTENTFQCRKCLRKKRKIQMSIFKDDNGNEYVNHIFVRHLCQPVKVSTIIPPEFVILKGNPMLAKEKPIVKANHQNLDENKIVRKPNFKLQPSQNGLPDRRLIITYPTDPNLYYQYFYEVSNKQFRCYKCILLKWHVYAKLHINENNNEQFIVMSQNEHKCEPLKRQQCQIIQSPNYVIYNKNEEMKSCKIFTFTSSAREFCYEFTYQKDNKCFRCLGCNRLKKEVFAKLSSMETGEECINLMEEHICKPVKYEPEQHRIKKIPESMFLLCPNSNGIKDKILMVFKDEKKDFVHTFSWNGKTFFCVKCSRKKIRIKAKICENENGEKYAELIGPEHVCTPKKFDPKKLPSPKNFKPETIPESMILITENSKGDKNKKLIVFTSDKHDFAYTFLWNHGNYYVCNRCRELKKYGVAGNLRINENGQRYLEMKNSKHICRPKNYLPLK